MRLNLVPVCLEFELFFGFMFFYNNEMAPYSTRASFKFACGLDERDFRIYLPELPQLGDCAIYEIDNPEIISKRFGETYSDQLSYIIKQVMSGAKIDKIKNAYTISTVNLRKFDKNGVKVTPIGISGVHIGSAQTSTNLKDPIDHRSEHVDMDVIVPDHIAQLSLF